MALARVPWLAHDAEHLRILAGVAVVAATLGYGLSPALRGWATGIGRWIAWSDRLAAWLSQLLAVGGVILCLRLALATLRERHLPAFERLVVVPAAASVLVLAVLASKANLSPPLALTGAAASSVVALASSAQAVRSCRTRALGLALGTVGLATLVQTGVRWMALEASRVRDTELFDTARALATLGLLLVVLTLTIVAMWLLSRSGHRLLAAAIAVVASGVVAWMADRGSTYGASGLLLLLGRALTEMMRQPSPLVAPLVRHWVVALSFAAAFAAVAWPRRDRPIQAALALVALTGAEADIPAFALILTLAALTAGLASTTEAPAAANAPAGSPDHADRVGARPQDVA
jgi:flagellar biogenesis protein FliO